LLERGTGLAVLLFLDHALFPCLVRVCDAPAEEIHDALQLDFVEGAVDDGAEDEFGEFLGADIFAAAEAAECLCTLLDLLDDRSHVVIDGLDCVALVVGRVEVLAPPLD
jgi:hypothetical protein